MLDTLSFTDIYIGEQASFLSGVKGELDPVPVPEFCAGEVRELSRLCRESLDKAPKKKEFPIRCNDVVYRVSTLETISETVFVLRRFSRSVPAFASLGYSPAYVSRLCEKGARGLIVFCGAVGQGKTTSASSLVIERLARYGGVAVTIEDPPEMPLEGKHGDGVCFQTWVDPEGFGQSCKNAARWAPSLIFMGEIRDGEAAIEALRASVNGRLVMCTFHSDNVIGAMERLCSIASSAAGSAEEVSSLMAHGIHSVIHQRLLFVGGKSDSSRLLRTEGLFFRDPGFEGVASVVRSRRFEQLGSDITRQSNLMMMEGGNRPDRMAR